MELATHALLPELRRAGIEYYRVDTADPADELANRGRWTLHNVSLAAGHYASLVRDVARDDVAVVYLPIAQEFPALLRDMAFVATALAAGKDVVVHLHGGMFDELYARQRPLMRRLMRATLGRVTAGVVLTERLRPALECVLPSDRVVCVANGIDLDGAEAVPRAEPREGVHVIFLSSLFVWKGTRVFIEAFAAAARNDPLLRATMAGSWPSDDVREQTFALAAREGVADRIVFPGVVEGRRKGKLLRGGDIFCFASLVPEGQPLVILEAMAAGLPVVSSSWPGIADTVVDGETGILVADREPASFAAALLQLGADPAMRARMGAAGRERYARLYTQRAFGDRMIALLRPLLDGEPEVLVTTGASARGPASD